MPQDLVRRALIEPSRVLEFELSDWDLFVRQCRAASLLGRVISVLADSNLLEIIPDAPRMHLSSANIVAQRQAESIRWEVRCISEALAVEGIDLILLKGAAYVMSDAWAMKGRTFSDVDILVRKSQIADAESALAIHGWHGSHHNDYDQRYYRQWMHEIPPMAHVKRGTTIDLHHAILPETARIKVATSALFENPVPIPGFGNVFVLRPEDMVLHSATHLFHEGELDNGLRDLTDLNLLFLQFGRQENFWGSLVERAERLGLQRPLFYAVFFCRQLLETPFPGCFIRDIETFSPNRFQRWVMTSIYDRGFSPNHASCRLLGDTLARLVLYVRSHWLKMPFLLLMRHLSYKAFLQLRSTTESHSAQRT